MESDTSPGSVWRTCVEIMPNIHSSWPMAICRSWRSETYDEDGDNVVSTAVVADNAGERDVSAVPRDVLSVSDKIVIGALLAAVSTLEGLDELPTSDVNPDVVDPKNRSSEFSMSSGEDTVEGADMVYTELIYSSNGSGGCSTSEDKDQLASGIYNGWLDTGTRPVEPEEETRD